MGIPMRIATWNIERLKSPKHRDNILSICNQLNADILVLTETDTSVRPQYDHCFKTPNLSKSDAACYKKTENRVSIFTNYPCIRQYPTSDPDTSLCVELATERGNLLLYGTIIGIYGNRNENFKECLRKQCADFGQLLSNHLPLCICGDYNLSFSDNYYFTNFGRNTLLKYFQEYHIKLLTHNVPSCIDHIALSEYFLENVEIKITEWNQEKKLSDHKGILVEF